MEPEPPPKPESKKQIARLIALGFALVSVPTVIFIVAWLLLERR